MEERIKRIVASVEPDRNHQEIVLDFLEQAGVECILVERKQDV